MPEHHGVRLREARSHPPQAPDRRTGVVDDRDPPSPCLDDRGRRQRRADQRVVDIAVHGDDVAVRPQLGEHLERDQIAGVEDQIRVAQALRRTRPAASARGAACGCPTRSLSASALSSPRSSSARSSGDRASASGAEGRRFKSCRARFVPRRGRGNTANAVGEAIPQTPWARQYRKRRGRGNTANVLWPRGRSRHSMRAPTNPPGARKGVPVARAARRVISPRTMRFAEQLSRGKLPVCTRRVRGERRPGGVRRATARRDYLEVAPTPVYVFPKRQETLNIQESAPASARTRS